MGERDYKHEEGCEMKAVDDREMLRLEAVGYRRARIAASVGSSHHTVSQGVELFSGTIMYIGVGLS